jgi:hypothetical protein
MIEEIQMDGLSPNLHKLFKELGVDSPDKEETNESFQ